MALFRRHHSALPTEQAPWSPRWPGATSASPALIGELSAMTVPATYAADLPVRLLLDGAGTSRPEDELVLPAALWERIGDLARAYWLSVAALVVDPGPTRASPAWDLVIFNRADRCAADMAIEARYLTEMVADPLLRRYLHALANLLRRWSVDAAERLVVATVGLDTPERTIDSFRARYLD